MRKLFNQIVYRCANRPSLKGSEPYQEFLIKASTNLEIVNTKGRTKLGLKVNVPFKPIGRQQCIKFFQQNNLRQKNILVDVDSSHLIGVRRQLFVQHMKKNVYKGVQTPVQTLQQSNPEYEFSQDELFFDDDIFFMTDPKFVHLWQTQKSQEQVDEIVQKYYDNNIDRGVQRLRQDFKLPQQFLYIIQTAHNFDNKIYFGGINQYDFRNVLWLYHTVDELKSMFVNAMHYWKEKQGFLRSQNNIDMIDFRNRCRQYIHFQNYHIFQPYRYNRLKVLRSKLVHCYTFAHQYAYHKANMDSMNIQFGKQHSKATQSDKIQKHAILQVMLGNLWNQPYSRNKFPNLSENYNKLNQKDQQIIDGIFNKHCSIYMKAIQKFRDKYYNEVSQKLKQTIKQSLTQ